MANRVISLYWREVIFRSKFTLHPQNGQKATVVKEDGPTDQPLTIRFEDGVEINVSIESIEVIPL